MHIAAMMLLKKKLLPALVEFLVGFEHKAKQWKDIIKVGRTHLMDATPITLGQEFSGYAAQIRNAINAIEMSLEPLSELAIGGTAVGTGINAPKQFGRKVSEVVTQLTGSLFVSAPNKFAALSSHDAIVQVSGALRQTACAFLKISNDIAWMGSGPRCGLFELFLPANEPGSSIMPGKVNPTQCEAMAMVSVQVMSNDSAIAIGNSKGNFELNVYKPLIIYNLIQSIHLLADTATCFLEKCLSGLRPNTKKIAHNLEKSLMLATALNQAIGYEKAATIVKKAFAEDISLKEAAVKLKILTAKKFDSLIDVKKMV
jgi:fumarate hydratase class II